MPESDLFEVTADHLKLLHRLNIKWSDAAYAGAPEVDLKRPYGNSDIERDVAEILGWKFVETRGGEDLSPAQQERAGVLHREMRTVLAIVTACNGAQPGRYVCERYCYNGWKRLEPTSRP